MKKQFMLLIVTAVLLIMGWTVIEYLLQSQIQYQYQQVSTYPVMIYSWDLKVMDSLKEGLAGYEFIRETLYKTGEQSATELIEKYGLKGAEEILREKALPDLLIIYLKGEHKARTNKLVLRDYLENLADKERIMVEYQDDIWNLTFTRIDQLRQVRWIVIAFLSLVIFIIFLLKRLHYEHHLARIRHLIQTRRKEDEEFNDHFWSNSMLLGFLPVGISFFLYKIFYYSDWLLYSIRSYFFLIQLGVILLATLVAYPFVIKYKHEEPPKKEEL
jgi:hypothetical protein